jgi:hypothetical protein
MMNDLNRNKRGIDHVWWLVAVVFFDVSADGQPLGRIEMTVRDPLGLILAVS